MEVKETVISFLLAVTAVVTIIRISDRFHYFPPVEGGGDEGVASHGDREDGGVDLDSDDGGELGDGD